MGNVLFRHVWTRIPTANKAGERCDFHRKELAGQKSLHLMVHASVFSTCSMAGRKIFGVSEFIFFTLPKTNKWLQFLISVTNPKLKNLGSLHTHNPRQKRIHAPSRSSSDLLKHILHYTMKLSIFLLSLGVVAGDKTMLKEGSLRNMQEEVPFELHEGKCMLAEDAWDMLPPEQRANQQGFENFNAFCGYGGSCFGDAEGCCRFANGLLIECDVDREFYHALVSFFAITQRAAIKNGITDNCIVSLLVFAFCYSVSATNTQLLKIEKLSLQMHQSKLLFLLRSVHLRLKARHHCLKIAEDMIQTPPST